ncbi:MAG: uracil phosphoribosyltransferase [Saprospiraceae bacterium]|nr:MAG: uracil phosphoribosyltransferase [Saprospiraceae bacterium]
MIFNLSEHKTVANRFLAELRDVEKQQDRMRFRTNMERLGEVLAYEISKTLDYEEKEVQTPLGTAKCLLYTNRVVVATILRAGLPFHQGMLNYFDEAGSAFVSAYRRHHKDGTFDIQLEYISCPDLTDSTLIIVDPMLASGASMNIATRALLEYGQPQSLHFVTAIASTSGLDYLRRQFPDASVWMGALDDELTAKSYIVPGLGDAGDLSYGEKLQD